MGMVTFNAGIRAISGRIGNLVFYGRNGGTFVRAHVVPRDPKTVRQLACRKAFASLVAGWRAMDVEERHIWNERARGRNLSGFNAFISANLKRRIAEIIASSAERTVTHAASRAAGPGFCRGTDASPRRTPGRRLRIPRRAASRAPCGGAVSSGGAALKSPDVAGEIQAA